MPYSITVDEGRFAYSTVNVRDYGATGNGVTDDLWAFNNAYNALVPNGGTIYVPPGTYILSGSFNINIDNIQVVGAGWGTQIRPNTSLISVPLIYVYGPGIDQVWRFGIKISDIWFYGNNNTGLGAIQYDSTYHALIDHCRFSHFPATAVYLNGYPNRFGAYTSIRECNFSDGGSGTAILTNQHEWNTIKGGLIAWYSTANGIGINLTGSNTQVIDVAFDEMDTSIALTFGAGNAVIGCGFDRGLTRYIRMQGSRNSRIIGNTFQQYSGTVGSTTASIIDVDSASNYDNIIANNVCELNSNLDTWAYFVRENSNTGSTPYGNMYHNNVVGPYPVQNYTGIWRGNFGYNPRGLLTAPTMPASGTAYANAFGVDCTVNIKGGTVTVIAVGGSTTGLTTTSTTSVPVRVLANQTITLTYSVAPTWVWIGE